MENQNETNELMPEPIASTLYIAGYLKTQIGKLVKVEFLIGNSITDRIGVLAKVGVSYIILRPIDVNGQLLCDLYSIKFVTIVERPTIPIYGGMGGI
jgi:hypothetical protein